MHALRLSGTVVTEPPPSHFLGIVSSAYFRHDDNGMLVNSTPRIRTQEMIDLGMVFKWHAVEQTVHHMIRTHADLGSPDLRFQLPAPADANI
jgi:hypothetical protein